MKRIFFILLTILLFSFTACEDILDTSDDSTTDDTTSDGSTSDGSDDSTSEGTELTGTYTDNGFDDQVSMDFAEYVLKEVNYARTNPTGYAAERLLEYENSGTDNGAYDDLTDGTYSAMGALSLNTKLNSAADKYAKVMAVNDIFEHGDVKGRIEAEGYNWMTYGENIAWSGYSTHDAESSAETAAINFVLQWMIDEGYPEDAAGHRMGIMNSTFTEIGVGYYKLISSPYNKHYGVQDFGKPR